MGTDPTRRARQEAASDAVVAGLALSFALSEPVRQFLGSNPGYWVLSDFFAATLIALVWMGRDGFLGRLLAGSVWLGMAFLALVLALELSPGLAVVFVLLSVRAHRAAKAADGGQAELARSYVAVMLAGIPTAVADAWGAPSLYVGVTMAVLTFTTSAWFRLHPPLDWIASYRPPAAPK